MCIPHICRRVGFARTDNARAIGNLATPRELKRADQASACPRVVINPELAQSCGYVEPRH
jgi:hypothetical protein